MPSNQGRKLVNKFSDTPVSECLIDVSEDEEYEVKSLIGQNCLLPKISKVRKVKNDFLETMYLLKKEELQVRYRGQVHEKLLLHATGEAKVNPIIKNNFDWRRVKRSKFGHGTSFSGDAVYANQYCNNRINGNKRAFIVTKVLISKCEEGYKDQEVPHAGFDTTIGNGKKVYVKFQDNEMLPVFVAFYDLAARDSYTVGFPLQKNIQSLVVVNKNYRGPNLEPNKKSLVKPLPSNQRSRAISPRPNPVPIQQPRVHNYSQPARNPTPQQPNPRQQQIQTYNINENQRYPVVNQPSLYRPSTTSQRQQRWTQDDVEDDGIYFIRQQQRTYPRDKKSQGNNKENKRKHCCLISACISVAEFLFRCCF